MKICPICKARCFDDMEICFGCMHQFAPKKGNLESESPLKTQGDYSEVLLDSTPITVTERQATVIPLPTLPVLTEGEVCCEIRGDSQNHEERKGQPRHAAQPPLQIRSQDEVTGKQSEVRFGARYQLVISLEPLP